MVPGAWRFPCNLQSLFSAGCRGVHLPGQCRTWAMKPGLFPVLVPHGSMWHVTGSSCPLLSQFFRPQVSLWILIPAAHPLRMAPPLLQVRV